MLKKIKKFWSYLGPGFTTGVSGDDPSGIATYCQTGAIFGFGQLWLALFTLPLIITVQDMCTRIGLVTSKGLITNLKDSSYPKTIIALCITLLSLSNIFNIGANLGAMAASFELITPIPFWPSLIACSAIMMLLIIFLKHQTYMAYLKILAFSLMSYIITALMLNLSWKKIIISSIKPSFSLNKEFTLNIVAVLGAIISPYLFFWQTNQIAEDNKQKQSEKNKESTLKTLRLLKIDTVIGITFSNLIMWFVIITTASTLYLNGGDKISSAIQSAEALKPLAGNSARLLFAFGIISTGLISIPVLAASLAYTFAELFDWKRGLDRSFKEAPQFYSTIITITIIGVLINFSNIDPITLLYYSAVINGITAPPLIFIIISLANNEKIMGAHKNNRLSNAMGGATGLIMTLAALFLLIYKAL